MRPRGWAGGWEGLLASVSHSHEIDEERDQQASVVAHELHGPIAIIAGLAELLVSEHAQELSPDAREVVEAIVTLAQRGEQVTAAVLEVARMGGFGPVDEPADSEAATREAVKQVRAKHGDVGRVDIGDLPPVAVRQSHLTQLLFDLLDNSFTHRASDRPVEVSVAGERVDGWVRFTVRDNGPGVPPEDRQQIFELLVRGNGSDGRPGVGIGLAACRRIVHGYGGSIECADSAGPGATFVFTLPAPASSSE